MNNEPFVIQTEGLSKQYFVPVIAVACWIVLFTAAALWRFGREEF